MNVDFINSSYSKKPPHLQISELHWKYAIRSVLRGDNLLIRGDSGFGKTLLAYSMEEVFKCPFFVFNMGAMLDPQSSLIGNKHYDKNRGTYVAESYFVSAIQTPNAIILLDEVTRAHPDAHNILMSVLDKNQRYLRIDSKPDVPTIKVANGVSFIGTANVGTQYTGTRTIDRAFLDRWAVLSLPHLTEDQEITLLEYKFPDLDKNIIKAIAGVAHISRVEMALDSSKIDTVISTRTTVEIAELIMDGFTFEEAAEIKIYPLFSDIGGVDSPQTFIRQTVQKYVNKPNTRSNSKNNRGDGAADPNATDPNNGLPAPF